MRYGKVLPQGAFSSDCFVKIYENTLSSATTSVTISGLDGNTDEEYILIGRIINGFSGAVVYRVRPNNDSGANYGLQLMIGENTTASASRVTDDTGFRFGRYLDVLNYSALAKMIIYAESGYIRTSVLSETFNISGATVQYVDLLGQSWNNTADNITSLVISADQTNGIGIGTYISLWKLSSKV